MATPKKGADLRIKLNFKDDDGNAVDLTGNTALVYRYYEPEDDAIKEWTPIVVDDAEAGVTHYDATMAKDGVYVVWGKTTLSTGRSYATDPERITVKEEGE